MATGDLRPLTARLVKMMVLADKVVDDYRKATGEGESFHEPLDLKDRLMVANVLMGLERLDNLAQNQKGNTVTLEADGKTAVIDPEKAHAEFRALIHAEGVDHAAADRICTLLVGTPAGNHMLRTMIFDSVQLQQQKEGRRTGRPPGAGGPG